MHVREHERDRLRVLVLEVREHLTRVSATKELEGQLDQRCAQALEHVARLRRPEGRFEHLGGEGHAALGEVTTCRREITELVEDVVGDVGVDSVEAGDLGEKLLDLLLTERLQHARRALLSHLEQEDGGLLGAGEAGVAVDAHGCLEVFERDPRHARYRRSASQPRRSSATSSG